MRLNVGCGEYPLAYWVNLDANPDLPADVHVTVPPLPFEDEALEEIYAGHFLEHLTPEDAAVFLAECYRCLIPGGRIGILVPDTYQIMRQYVDRSPFKVEYPEGNWLPVNNLDAVCGLFLYSTIQESPHRWSYDIHTLRLTLERAGFKCVGEIDRYNDPRIPVGAWYQCGWDAVKEER